MRGYHTDANGDSSILGYDIVLNSKELPEFRTRLLPLKSRIGPWRWIQPTSPKRLVTNVIQVLISPYPEQEGNKLQRQKILIFLYPIYNHNWRNISTICITRLVSNEIFSPSNKIHREVGRAKDLSAPLYQ